MANAKFEIPIPPNEPVKNYLPGSSERNSLKAKLEEMQNNNLEIPLIIGGEEIKTGRIGKCILPHDHKTVIATYHQAGKRKSISQFEQRWLQGLPGRLSTGRSGFLFL